MTRERCSCGASVEADKGDRMYAATLESMHVAEWRKKHRCNADSKLIGLLKRALPAVELHGARLSTANNEQSADRYRKLAADIRAAIERKR